MLLSTQGEGMHSLRWAILQFQEGKMIRTKFLFCNHPLHEPIDKQINDWLTKNPDIELIDIKFQPNVSVVADSGVSAEYWHTSALIIYKDPEKSSQE